MSGQSGTAAARAAVERELTKLLRRSRASSTRLAGEVHPDLDAAGSALLVTVLELGEALPGGVRAADVTHAVGLHKSTTSRNISQLESLGLIERVPDRSDARARLLRVTTEGRAAVSRSRQARRRRLAAQMDGWSTADLEELARLLGRLNDELL